jgi:hypothetical protein
MKIYVRLWYLDELCLEWEMFQRKVVEEKHILRAINFFRKSCSLCEKM